LFAFFFYKFFGISPSSSRFCWAHQIRMSLTEAHFWGHPSPFPRTVMGPVRGFWTTEWIFFYSPLFFGFRTLQAQHIFCFLPRSFDLEPTNSTFPSCIQPFLFFSTPTYHASFFSTFQLCLASSLAEKKGRPKIRFPLFPLLPLDPTGVVFCYCSYRCLMSSSTMVFVGWCTFSPLLWLCRSGSSR